MNEHLEGGDDSQAGFKSEILSIEREILVLNVVIEEGDVMVEGLNSRFWAILKRTCLSLSDSYKHEAYEAVQKPSISPGFFLGRMANIDDILFLAEVSFFQGKERAITRKEACLQRIKEIREILDRKSGLGYTGGTGES